MPNWSKEHFTVASALPKRKFSKRMVYKLNDYNGEPVTGSLYDEELQHIYDYQYRIERVLRRGTAADGTRKCLQSGKGGSKHLISGFALISSTMLLGDPFQVTLPSNVKGNDKNTAGQYETTLDTPLDLPGDWELALIDNTYSHT